MKRWTAGLTAAILATALLLGGCTEAPAGSSRVESEETSSTTGTSTATTSSPSVEIPEPVTGTYNGQTITMKVSVITDLKWHERNAKTSVFVNGYAAIYFYEGFSESDEDYTFHGASYMDKDGRLISEPQYMMLKDFNEDGLALALGMDGVYYVLDGTGRAVETRTEDSNDWSVFNYEAPCVDENGFVSGLKVKSIEGQHVIVNTAGETVATLPNTVRDAMMVTKDVAVCTYGRQEDGWFGEYMQMHGADGKLLNDTKFERIGTFYKGLAPVYKDGKLGLISDTGEVVIPLSISCRADLRFIAFNEDRIVISIDGYVSIIEVIRS